MKTHLEAETEKIKNKLLSLSSIVSRNLEMAIKSIITLDSGLAEEVKKSDFEIDLKEVHLEEDVLKALALYQPVASDLRFLVVALKINNDLERIGDLACNLASRAEYLVQLKKVEIPFNFELMSEKVTQMVKNSIQSLIHMDAQLARQVLKDDDEVDKINKNTYPVVFSGIRQSPEHVEQLVHYLSISRFMERVGDLATNIAEDIIYMIDGVIVRHNVDGTSSEVRSDIQLD
jgi:phosphate transport system protein